MGIQFCDQAGRLKGILDLQPNSRAASLTFGTQRDNHYVCAGDKVYRRLTIAKGFRSADTSIKPPAPRL